MGRKKQNKLHNWDKRKITHGREQGHFSEANVGWGGGNWVSKPGPNLIKQPCGKFKAKKQKHGVKVVGSGA